MKTKILTLLRNSEKYLSGQELCEKLGVSRTAVWKVMNQLKDDGYEIESGTNKGYKIIKYPDLISKSAIESRINTKLLGKDVRFFSEVDSTNTIAKRIAEEQNTSGTLIIAEQQTQGKGRRGRTWSSPSGAGIWMSLILKPDIKPINASMLTLVTALAVVKSIQNICKIEALIKWPNDIVIHGKKVCGILTQMSAEIDYINHIVIGIGINANTEEFPEELREIATSLFLQGGKKIMRADLVADIMREFEHYYFIFLKDENLEEFIEEYNKILVNANNEVMILQGSSSYKAFALGINAKGELLVRKTEESQNQEIQTIVAGEVSVRGIYGYV